MAESQADLKPVRCFLGVPLDAALAARLPLIMKSELQQTLMQTAPWQKASSQKATSHTSNPAPRMVASGNLHLTLAFLGDQPLSLIHALRQELQSPLSAWPAFTLHSYSINAFPDAKSAIIALEFEPLEIFQRLKQTLDVTLQHKGVVVESRPVRPHITLARGKRGQRLTLPPIACELELNVNEVCLFESKQGAAGNDYRPLWSIPLKENANSL